MFFKPKCETINDKILQNDGFMQSLLPKIAIIDDNTLKSNNMNLSLCRNRTMKMGSKKRGRSIDS